jgi:probable selenium-dependent hydroxylase accessory protein YqeC
MPNWGVMIDPRLCPPGWRPLQQALALTGGGVVTLVGAGGKTTLMFSLARQLAAPDTPVLTTTTTKIQLPTEDHSPHLLEVRHAGGLLERLERLDTIPSHLTALSPVEDHPEKRTGLDPSGIDSIAAGGRLRWILVEGDGAARKPLKAPADHEPVIPASCTHVIVVAGLDGLGRPLIETHVHRADLFSKLSGLPLGEAVTPEALAAVANHPEGGRKGVPAGARITLLLNKADHWGWRSAGRSIRRYLDANRGGDLRVVVGSAMKGRGVRL